MEKTISSRTGLLKWLPETGWQRWALLFISLGIIYRLIRYIVRMPIWGDEAMLAINFLDRGFGDLFSPLEHDQVLPAGYLALSWSLMQLLGYSEWVLRIPATMASIAALFLMYKLALSVASRSTAVVALGTLAASYYSTRYGAEFKPYAMDLALSTWVIYLAYRLKSTNETQHYIWFLFAIIVAPFFSYPSAFVIAACMLVLGIDSLLNKQFKTTRNYILIAICAAIVYVSYYFSFIKPQSAHSVSLYNIWAHTFPPNSWIEFPGWLLSQLGGRMLAYPHGGSNFGSSLSLILCILGVISLIRKQQHFLLALLLTPFLITLIASFLHLYPFGESVRFAHHLAPSILILLAIGVLSLCREIKPTAKPVIVWLSLCLLLNVAGIALTIKKPYKSKSALEVRNVVETLAHEYQCKPILLLNNEQEIPINFRWYLSIDSRSQFIQSKYHKALNNEQVCLLLFDKEQRQHVAINKIQIDEIMQSRQLIHNNNGQVQIYGHNVDAAHSYEAYVWK